MSNSTLITFGVGIFEMLSYYGLLLLLDKANYLPKIKLACYMVLSSCVSCVLNYYSVPYHFIYMILTYVALLKIMGGNKLKSITIDVIIAGSCYIAMQFIITIVVSLINGDIFNNYYLLFSLVISLALFIGFLNTRTKFVELVQHYYIDSRDTVFLIAMNLFFTVTILLNIWNNFGDLFWNEKLNILGLVAANYIMNMILVVTFFRHKRTKEESEANKMYGKYLEDISLQLRSRQHEYMNQIHTMIGLAQTLSPEECTQAITEYGEIIIQDNEKQNKQFEICSNAIVTAVIYGKEKQANLQKIQFQHVIQEPLDQMGISAHDLAEILNNLLNNAFEAVSDLLPEDREVLLEISPNKIEVLNRIPSEFNEGLNSQIEQVGYSTKGHNRGYGISNVISIVKRYNGSFSIFKQNDMFIFEILF